MLLKQRVNILCDGSSIHVCMYLAISLLRLAQLSREQNQSRLVLFEALGIDLQTFQRSIDASIVNGDANSLGEIFVNASSLKRLNREYYK